MNIAEMVDKRLISFGLDAGSKEEVFKSLAKMMYEAGKVTDEAAYIKGLYERELEGCTGIGNGIAMPHCKSDCVKTAAFTLVKLKQPIEWESYDEQPVDYIIMLAAPNTSDNIHLKMLSALAVNLMDDDFRNGLKDATDFGQIIHIFKNKKEEE